MSGTTGRTNSAIRAGLLTFLAALHGGITVDGVSAAWLPLGMLAIVGLTAWRAGSGLADAADDSGETDPARLLLAALAQMLSFTVGCLAAVPFATLGTSRAPFLGVGIAAAAVFTLTGGVAFVRSSEVLRDWCAQHSPPFVRVVARAGAAAAVVYVAMGALLAVASLVLHHSAAERLSHSVGGGLGGVPVLLLGVLAAPNVAIAGAAYLAGPGFALGVGHARRPVQHDARAAAGVPGARRCPVRSAEPGRLDDGRADTAARRDRRRPARVPRRGLVRRGWPQHSPVPAVRASPCSCSGGRAVARSATDGCTSSVHRRGSSARPWPRERRRWRCSLWRLAAGWQWVRHLSSDSDQWDDDEDDGADDEPFLRVPRLIVAANRDTDTDEADEPDHLAG